MSVSFAVSVRPAGNSIAEADARRVRMARRLASARLRYCGLTGLIDDASLVVSELVTNAIVHSGGTQVTFTMAIGDGSLNISVHDAMPGGPRVHNASGDEECGRGLFLVECIANAHDGAWGTSDAGATTWCRLALPGEQR
ncbi:ATP-binding protein [Streptomyces sp. NPDC087568]|uniref:ATP-binding protein n=1 Tax=unclassified Streptomyces TaxID=2593676 RepID=UPI0037F9DE5B